ncbi:MAG: hypothetical protein PWR20_1138 [Bacteroidales bacterium]|jgi:Fe-S cluster assembly iron-binding protein IscA|nr:hypothetical protein [Bacteroidales bacterium]MDN5330169.1 hypothetical protein [Bacteroidales bacterium]
MKLTENALNQFKKLIDESENPKSGIRFFTVQGCCSPVLQMCIEEKPGKDDLVIQIGEIDFFLTVEAHNILSDITLDYYRDSFRMVSPTTDTQTKKCC